MERDFNKEKQRPDADYADYSVWWDNYMSSTIYKYYGTLNQNLSLRLDNHHNLSPKEEKKFVQDVLDELTGRYILSEFKLRFELPKKKKSWSLADDQVLHGEYIGFHFIAWIGRSCNPKVLKDLYDELTLTNKEQTPFEKLYLAVALKQDDAIDQLKKNTKDILEIITTWRRNFRTIFHLAIFVGNQKIIQLLNVSDEKHDENNEIQLLDKIKEIFIQDLKMGRIKGSDNPSYVDQYGVSRPLNDIRFRVKSLYYDMKPLTPLAIACYTGQLDIAKSLLKYLPEDPFLKDQCLHEALYWAYQGGYLKEIVDFLFKETPTLPIYCEGNSVFGNLLAQDFFYDGRDSSTFEVLLEKANKEASHCDTLPDSYIELKNHVGPVSLLYLAIIHPHPSVYVVEKLLTKKGFFDVDCGITLNATEFENSGFALFGTFKEKAHISPLQVAIRNFGFSVKNLKEQYTKQPPDPKIIKRLIEEQHIKVQIIKRLIDAGADIFEVIPQLIYICGNTDELSKEIINYFLKALAIQIKSNQAQDNEIPNLRWVLNLLLALMETNKSILKEFLIELLPSPTLSSILYKVLKNIIEDGEKLTKPKDNTSSWLSKMNTLLGYLLESGANVNPENVLNSPLFYTITANQEELFAKLLPYAKANNELENQSYSSNSACPVSPLICAITKEKLFFVEKLLQAGCRIEACDKNGATALHHAALCQNVDILQLLLDFAKSENENSVKNLLQYQDKNSCTLLHYAVQGQNPETLKLLVRYAKNTHNEDCFKNLFQRQDKNGCTPLHHVASKTKNKNWVDTTIAKIEILLGETTSSINTANNVGVTPFGEIIISTFNYPLLKYIFSKNIEFNIFHIKIAHNEYHRHSFLDALYFFLIESSDDEACLILNKVLSLFYLLEDKEGNISKKAATSLIKKENIYKLFESFIKAKKFKSLKILKKHFILDSSTRQKLLQFCTETVPDSFDILRTPLSDISTSDISLHGEDMTKITEGQNNLSNGGKEQFGSTDNNTLMNSQNKNLSNANSTSIHSGNIPLADPKKISRRIGHLFDPNRRKRHENAQSLLLSLYHIGAQLINHGKAYNQGFIGLGIERLAKNLENHIASQEASSIIPRNTSTMTIYRELSSPTLGDNPIMAIYRNLPLVKSKERGNNQLHALFIIRVALDHLPAEAIVQADRKITEDSALMTTGQRVNFPNGTCFPNDTALSQIILMYMMARISRFPELNNEDIEQFILIGENWQKTNTSFNFGMGLFSNNNSEIGPKGQADFIFTTIFGISLPDVIKNLRELNERRIVIEELDEENVSESTLLPPAGKVIDVAPGTPEPSTSVTQVPTNTADESQSMHPSMGTRDNVAPAETSKSSTSVTQEPTTTTGQTGLNQEPQPQQITPKRVENNKTPSPTFWQNHRNKALAGIIILISVLLMLISAGITLFSAGTLSPLSALLGLFSVKLSITGLALVGIDAAAGFASGLCLGGVINGVILIFEPKKTYLTFEPLDPDPGLSYLGISESGSSVSPNNLAVQGNNNNDATSSSRTLKDNNSSPIHSGSYGSRPGISPSNLAVQDNHNNNETSNSDAPSLVLRQREGNSNFPTAS